MYKENWEGVGGHWGFLSREDWTLLSIGTELSSSQAQSRVIAIEEEPKGEQEVWADCVSRFDLDLSEKEGMQPKKESEVKGCERKWTKVFPRCLNTRNMGND